VANLVPFRVDLTTHEGLRLAAVMDALGPGWDPLEILTGEAQAHRMLYANLDAQQQAAHELLIAAGVLPDILEVKRS
jgi:Family of unknown function (DUF6400)